MLVDGAGHRVAVRAIGALIRDYGLMGAWGVGLFSDDTALDVRGSYRGHLERGVSDEEARAATLAEFASALADQDEGPVVWLALATTQSSLGRLDAETKAAAIAVIDNRRGLDRWVEQPSDVRRRLAVLGRVRKQLEGEQPPRRSVSERKQRRTPLSPGDVLSYRAENGLVFLVRVVELHEGKYEAAPHLLVLDYEGSDVPSADVISGLQDRAAEAMVRGKPSPRWWSVDQIALGVRGHKRAGFEVVGKVAPRPVATPLRKSYGPWKAFARFLERASIM